MLSFVINIKIVLVIYVVYLEDIIILLMEKNKRSILNNRGKIYFCVGFWVKNFFVFL